MNLGSGQSTSSNSSNQTGEKNTIENKPDIQ